MNRKVILMTAAILVMTSSLSVQAQVLKKLEEKAKKTIKEKVENAVNGKNESSSSSTPSQKETSDPVSLQEKPTSTDQKGSNSTAGTTAKVSQYKTKFDFIPGEKIILWDDFSEATLGDMPADWSTNGSGEVVEDEDFPGKWLMLGTKSVFSTPKLTKLSDHFTLQFDLLCSAPFTKGNSLYLEMADVKDRENYTRGNSVPMNESIEITIHPGAPQDYSMGYGGYYYQKTQGNLEQRGSFEITDFRSNATERQAKISLWRQGTRIRLYVNDKKVLDLNSVLSETIQLNAFTFSTNSYLGANQYFISNIRIAEDNPSTNNKLLNGEKLVSNSILFDVNSDTIKPESYGILREIATALSQTTTKIKIIGHTDSDGEEKSNLDLSRRRAESVKNALINDFKLGSDRFTADGKGESEPMVPNTSRENKATNRRVEFIPF